MGQQARVPTGSDVLDRILDGGLPENRAVLVTGTPGTGKSTLAMQFLQRGLDAGEQCLFISTEQTVDELRDSFASFEFGLDHEHLDIATLHAATGETFEADSERLTLQALEPGEEAYGGWVEVPFTTEHVRDYLSEYAPVDRVVLDSVSGLEVLADDQERYRRNVLDLVQFFTHELGATTVFTAETSTAVETEYGVETIETDDAIQYSVHGVVRLWREPVEGDFRRFIDVMKMRGVDHDTRRFEITFDSQGLHISPRRRSEPGAFVEHRHLETGIDGFDEFAGGGLLTDTGVLLEHDGQANTDALLMQMVFSALEAGQAHILVPSVDFGHPMTSEAFDAGGWDFDELLDANRLFVLDMLGSWERRHENVFDVQSEDAGVEYLLEMIDDRSAADDYFALMNTEAKIRGLGEEKVPQFRYWLESQFVGKDDVLLDVHNPELMSKEFATFYVDAAGQVVKTWMDRSGLQYLHLKKSPTGDVGGTRLVEYADEPPYIEIK